MVKAKKFVYAKPFEGFPKEDNFKLVEEELPSLNDGEFLAEALFLSVDPYMRGYSAQVPIGAVYIGSQVARIIESRNASFPEGKHVVGYFGWRTHTISDGSADKRSGRKPYLIPDMKDLSPSLGIGILGMPGNTAYFGTLELLDPQPGKTLVVSGAAGAVGSLVGQIGKIKGAKVIGIAGTDEKGEWLVKELGFDHFINYKTSNVGETLHKIASEGVDYYFDNVGGEITNAVIDNMNLYGRIAVCGLISKYNEKSLKAELNEVVLLQKQLRIEGFVVGRWIDRWMEGIHQNLKWIREGKLEFRETVTEGFENMPKAFIDMLKGGNTGKAVIKA